MSAEIRRVAVVGAGTIGTGWATFFASRGLAVNLFDADADATAAARDNVRAQLRLLARHGLLAAGQGDEEADAAARLVAPCRTLEEAVAEADMVQEAVFETYEAKRAVFQTLDAIAGPDVPLASSSSGLLMTEIQPAARRHPERCLVAHPIHPVYLIPLVELVPGVQTDPSFVAAARRFFAALGKVPVTLTREVPGYLENRMTAALWREAIDLVHQGVATVEDVDRAIWAGPGLRYALLGPLMIYHLGGGEGGVRAFVDHLGPAFTAWWADLRTWNQIPEGALDRLQAGLEQAMGGKTLAEIAAWRDARLIELLKIVGPASHAGDEEGSGR